MAIITRARKVLGNAYRGIKKRLIFNPYTSSKKQTPLAGDEGKARKVEDIGLNRGKSIHGKTAIENGKRSTLLLDKNDTQRPAYYGKFIMTRYNTQNTKRYDMSEISAGKSWHKKNLAKSSEFSSIPLYLRALGHVLFFPVDVLFYSASKLSNLLNRGHKFITRFWKNPAMELSFLWGYVKARIYQLLNRK